MTDERDTIPAASPTPADLLRAIGECATRAEMQAIFKALKRLADQVEALNEGKVSDEVVSRVAQKVLERIAQAGNGAG